MEGCPICFLANAVLKGQGDRYQVACRRCGQFALTGSAAGTIRHWKPERRHWLAGRTRRRSFGFSAPLYLRSELLDAVDGPELRSVSQKQLALVSDIAGRSAYPGQRVEVKAVDSVVVDATDDVELRYHRDALVERGLLRQAERGSEEYTLTVQGWEYIDQFRNPSSGNRSDIFVAMAFALEDAWQLGLKPGIAAAGYTPKRVDSEAHNDKIDDRIMAGIRSSFATVVDVTTQNQGAYFEAGFALGLGRPVVWTVREDEITKLHFDTRQFNHIRWDTPQDLARKLEEHLIAVFGRGPMSVLNP